MSSKEIEKKDKIVLSYYDCLLRNQDVDLLRGPCWLNDTIIGFYFEYLQRQHDEEQGDKREILFVSPELTQLLKLTPIDDYAIFLEPLNAKECNYLLFPLNDCKSRESAGGSHWSLLVFSKKERACFHLDSFRVTKQQMAHSLVQNIINYFLNTNEIIVEEIDCPQQETGYDCGYFVICYADIIVRQVKKVTGIRECKFDGAKSLVRTKKEDLLDLIDELKKKQEN